MAKTKIYFSYFVVSLFFSLIFGTGVMPVSMANANSATLYLLPASSYYSVGDTFPVSVLVNTADQNINAVEANLSFPPDKLQIVSPSMGKSVIGIWIGQPEYSNSEGTISLRGAIPNPGLNSKNALVTTITFRARASGRATISFLDSSKVLLNDGKGTNVLNGNKSGAVIDLGLPPPEGPIVVSSTHPDQIKWYQSNNPALSWANELGVESYSYELDDNALTIPDDVSEGMSQGIVYHKISDGGHYFHIKSKRQGVWGGTTHFAIQIDSTPPAQFPVRIDPSSRTNQRRPLIQFQTTDRDSGVSFYEVRVIPLGITASSSIYTQPFFAESASPYVPTLDPNTYDVAIRAYDNAGNVREVLAKLTITSSVISANLLSPTNLWLFILTLAFVISGLYIFRRQWG